MDVGTEKFEPVEQKGRENEKSWEKELRKKSGIERKRTESVCVLMNMLLDDVF